MSCIIENNIYLGDLYDINTKFLEKNKIERIINLCFQKPKFIDLEKYEYHNIQIYDSVTQNIIPVIDKVQKILSDEKKSTLINCYAGVSRSATVVIGVLIKGYGYSLDESFNHVFERRSKIDPNNGFMLQLQDYEKTCIKEREKRDKNIEKITKNVNNLLKITKFLF